MKNTGLVFNRDQSPQSGLTSHVVRGRKSPWSSEDRGALIWGLKISEED